MYLTNLFGLLGLAVVTVAMFLVVPRERIKALGWFGLIFGAGLAFVVLGIMQNLLGFWTFRNVDPITVAGLPPFLAITWTPAEIIYAHLLGRYRSAFLGAMLIVSVAAGATFYQFVLILNGMLVMQNWSLAHTFLFSVFIHLGLVPVLSFMGHLNLRELL